MWYNMGVLWETKGFFGKPKGSLSEEASSSRGSKQVPQPKDSSLTIDDFLTIEGKTGSPYGESPSASHPLGITKNLGSRANGFAIF